jgi:hypothetical protein
MFLIYNDSKYNNRDYMKNPRRQPGVEDNKNISSTKDKLIIIFKEAG